MSPVETGLAILLTLATALSDGLKAYQEKRYDDAKKQFTTVVDKADVGGEHWQAALLYRAKTFVALEKKDLAKKDLVALLKWPGKASFRKEGLTLYLKLDGKKADYLPNRDPKEIVLAYLDLSKRQNYDAALKLCTGSVKKTLLANRKAKALRGNNRAVGNANVNQKVKKTIIGEGKDFGKAWVVIEPNWRGQGQVTYLMYYEVVLFPKANEWRLATNWYQMQFNGDDAAEGAAARKGEENVDFNRKRNSNDLELLGLALASYAKSNDNKYPKTLAEIKNEAYQEDGKAYLWTHPFTGNETLAYLYCPGLTKNDPKAAEKVILASPDSYDDKRQVLYADGHVSLIDDTAFKTLIKAQNWSVKSSADAFKGSNKTAKKAEALIKDLAAADFKKRRAAKKGLKELGKPIVPILQRYLEDEDPEVRESVKALIEGM